MDGLDWLDGLDNRSTERAFATPGTPYAITAGAVINWNSIDAHRHAFLIAFLRDAPSRIVCAILARSSLLITATVHQSRAEVAWTSWVLELPGVVAVATGGASSIEQGRIARLDVADWSYAEQSGPLTVGILGGTEGEDGFGLHLPGLLLRSHVTSVGG